MKLQTRTVKNGISLGTVHKPGAESCIFYISADISHITHYKALTEVYGDILLSGAGPYQRQELLENISRLGTDISITEANGVVTFAVKCLSTKLKQTLILLEHILLNPHFNKKEITRAKKSAVNALHVYQENARAQALIGLKHVIFTKFNRRFEPTTETLSKNTALVTHQEITALHSILLRQSWTISIGGTDKDIALIESKLSSIKPPAHTDIHTNSASLFTKSPKNLNANLIKSKHNIELSLGKYIPLTLADDVYPSLQFGVAVLGLWGGFAGRLMSTVREKEGLTYGIYTQLESATTIEEGYLRIMTFFSPQDTIKGLTSTFREISTLHNDGISNTELNQFKTILHTRHQLVFDSLHNSTQFIHQCLLRGLNIDTEQRYTEKLMSVTRDSVHHALTSHMNPSTFVLSMAGPTHVIQKDVKTFCTQHFM